MKILGISCSPRKKGNTDILIEQALDGATKEGAIPIFMSIRDLSIFGCDGCYSCAKSGKCTSMMTCIQFIEHLKNPKELYLVPQSIFGQSAGRQR